MNRISRRARHSGLTLALGAGLCLAALALAVPGLARAAEPVARAAEGSWGYALWSDLMSPFCPGRTLADCTSGEAEQLRSWILVQAASGRSREQVEAELFERYGDVILSAPRAEGIGLAAYLLPALAFAAGGSGIAFFLARQTRGARGETRLPEGPAGSAPLDPELERLVDAELERREAS